MDTRNLKMEPIEVEVMYHEPPIYKYIPKTTERLQDETWYPEFHEFCEWAAFEDWWNYKILPDTDEIRELYLMFYEDLNDEKFDGDMDRLQSYCEYELLAIPGLIEVYKEFGNG